jgi:hypothetical protein
MFALNRIRFTLFGLALTLGLGAAQADVVVVVSSKCTVTTLTKAQVAAIFLGKTIRLPDGAEVHPLDQDEGTAARDEFYANFTGKSPAQVKAYWAKVIFTGRGQQPRSVSNSIEVRKLLAGRPEFIAYVERGAVDASMRVLTGT